MSTPSAGRASSHAGTSSTPASALVRAMRKIDYLLDRDPFEALIWPRQCLVSNPKRCGDQAAASLLHATHLYQRGLSNGVNIKWLAEYCGTSVATIERHYGKYIKSDAAEQLERLAGTVTPTVIPDNIKRVAVGQGD